jgi:hypothetical protein
MLQRIDMRRRDVRIVVEIPDIVEAVGADQSADPNGSRPS